ncbi:hypothetical protein ACFY1A_38975 [Streptomyces sp. NPDC001520]|uniref:hypothetical protein n=1 Tax=Streptomyces sp. NPDC001520 TaxID=3364581 RepID=UPI0036B8FF1E
MGYTHYFAYSPRTKAFRESWPSMVADTRRIVAHVQSLGIAITGPMGRGQPEITERYIGLNGMIGHESLWIQPDPPDSFDDPYRAQQYASRGFVWSFCKTAQKPYDLAVAAILLRCWQLAPRAFAIASDGHWESEWKLGTPSPRALVASLFPSAAVECPFSDTTQGPAQRDLTRTEAT